MTNMTNQVSQFLEDPTLKVEVEFSEQATTRVVIMAMIIAVTVFSLMVIYKKLN